MEKIMRKTDDTSKLVTIDDQLDDHGALADNELDAVNGGATKKQDGMWRNTPIPNQSAQF
jgi:hypothetical protein